MSEIPTEETTAVDPHVQLLLDNLISIIRGGKTPEQAASSLRAVARDPETVDRALEEYWAEVGRTRILHPAIETREGPGLWYPGPRPDDRCWPALRRHLEGKGWGDEAVTSLNESSSKIVSLLAPPWAGVINTRGLVVGYIQTSSLKGPPNICGKS